MKFIMYEEALIYSVPNEEERLIAENLIRRDCIDGGTMDPIIDFDYTLKHDDIAGFVDKHFETGELLAEHIYGLHVDAWSW